MKVSTSNIDWAAATKSNPCPACGKPKWCMHGAAGGLCNRDLIPDGCHDGGEQAGGGRLWWVDAPTSPSDAPARTVTKPTKPTGSTRGTSGELDRVYTRLLALCPLTSEHRDHLATERRLSPEEVAGMQVGSLPSGRALRDIADTMTREFGDTLLRVPGFRLGRGESVEIVAAGSGLLIPYLERETVTAVRLRLDEPGDGGRYRWLSGGGGPGVEQVGYVTTIDAMISGLAVLTEGEFKAFAAAKHWGALAIGVPGVTSYDLALPVLREHDIKTVILAMDADHRTNPHVYRATRGATDALRAAGVTVRLALWNGRAKGVDDAIQSRANINELSGNDIDIHLSRVRVSLGIAAPAVAIAATHEGYSPSPREPKPPRSSDKQTNPTESRSQADAPSTVSDWPEIEPHQDKALPEFPLEIFPLWIRRYLLDLSRVLQVPPGFVGMLTLGMLAIIWQKRAKVIVHSAWSEPLILWILLIAPSGSRKSPAFSKTLAPLLAWETRMAEDFKDVRKRAKRRIREVQALIDDAKKQKVKNLDFIREQEDLLEALFVPINPRLYTGTATPEAIEERIEQHHGRYGFASAESDILAVLMGKYKSGAPPVEGLLSSWTGEAIKADYRSRDDVNVNEAHFSQVLCTQPSNAQDMYQNEKLSGRGALGRYLPCLPNCQISEQWITEPADPSLCEEFFNGVLSMLPDFSETLGAYLGETTDENEAPEPGGWKTRELQLSEEASKVMGVFFERTRDRCQIGGDLQFLEEWGAKFRGQVVRVAGLLHLADHAFGEAPREVSRDALERAIKLGESYFIPHAKAVFGSAASLDTEKVWAILRAMEKPEVPRKDLTRAVRPLSGAKLSSALGILEEQGLLRVEKRPTQTSRKPPSFIVVNPKVYGTYGTYGTYSTNGVDTRLEGHSENGTYSELLRNLFQGESEDKKLPISSKEVPKSESSTKPDDYRLPGISSISSISSKRSGPNQTHPPVNDPPFEELGDHFGSIFER